MMVNAVAVKWITVSNSAEIMQMTGRIFMVWGITELELVIDRADALANKGRMRTTGVLLYHKEG